MDVFCWELESSERDTSNVARVETLPLTHGVFIIVKSYFMMTSI
jgi:hypothetical protein